MTFYSDDQRKKVMMLLNQGGKTKSKKLKRPNPVKHKKISKSKKIAYQLSPSSKNVVSIYSRINQYQSTGKISESNERILRTKIYTWANTTSKNIEKLPNTTKRQIKRSIEGTNAILTHSDSMNLSDLLITFSNSIQGIHINSTRHKEVYNRAFGFPVSDEWGFAHIKAQYLLRAIPIH